MQADAVGRQQASSSTAFPAEDGGGAEAGSRCAAALSRQPPRSLPAAAALPLQALQEREEAVRNGKLATIIFLRGKNGAGQEVRHVPG